MIGYVTLGMNDVARARAFYDALFGSIGLKRTMTSTLNDFTLYGTSLGRPGLAITRPWDGAPATPGNGVMVAIPFKRRAEIDAFHARAMALGATDEGAPGLRGEEGPDSFYGGYFRDPEGNKLCAYIVGPERD